ncbi:hypothetical protein [Streptomyces dysideae]|uniref:hypothetical protein n=1 Tax=Streptomyces dysideae TaxID=909626 RepID=UPI001F43E096|nr:hypothetical protein [Streptomyces dysideae]
MKKWLEDAQPEWPEPEWPEVASGTDEPPSPPPIPVPRDPWDDEPHDPGLAHDPHEVTIQLDDMGVQLDHPTHPAKGGSGGGPDGSDGPVFVDESGRRSRRYRRIGIAVGGACAVYAVVIVGTLLSGNSNAPWLPVPGQKDEQPAAEVETSPLPAESAARPTGPGAAAPGTTPTSGPGTAPVPGASPSGSAASASPGKPGASAAPEPSATRTVVDPGTGSTPDPGPSDPPVTGLPDPSPSVSADPSPDPSVSVPPDNPGTDDTVADGPAGTAPVTQEPGPDAAPSPENVL